jgi:CBS domain containing-hemolysin-like protein
MTTWMIVVTLLLLLGNAFFVGAEFAAMAARRSQLEPLAEAGSSRARVAIEALGSLGSLLATAQLGITVCSVLLGAFSEAALHHALEPVVARLGLPEGAADAGALVLALLIVVYLHVVLGEMIPKNLAIAAPERVAVALVPPLYQLSRIFRPVIAALEHVAKAVVQAFGIEPRDELAAEFTAEEVAHIVDESHREGLVGVDRYARIGAALEFSDKDAADVGVALTELVTVTTAATPAQIERLVAKHGYSRFPVVDASGIPFGYLHLKDVLYAADAERGQPVPPQRVRRLATVRGDDEVEAVLSTMQETGAHLARVMSAAGQVTGVVFLEDVLEELVGEVMDASQRS